MLAVAALVLACLNLGVMRYGLTRRDATLTRAIDAEAAVALPGARLVAPRAQLEAAAAAAGRRQQRLGAEAGVLELLRDVSTRVPPGLRLDLDELAIEGDGIALHGRCDSFDAVDALRRALAGSPLLADVTADETRTTVDGRRVEFHLRAARRTVTGASS
jgi:Tfp pilus assembly protein PilN